MVKSRLLLLYAFVFLGCSSTLPSIEMQEKDGQYTLTDAGFSVDLPSYWNPTQIGVKKKTINGYNYARDPVIDNSGLQVVPFISIMYEKVDNNTDLIFYSVFKRSSLPPFKIDEVLTGDHEEYPLPFGIGYLGHYYDSMGILHKIFIIHVISNDWGIQIIIDGTASIFEVMKEEYIQIIKSISII